MAQQLHYGTRVGRATALPIERLGDGEKGAFLVGQRPLFAPLFTPPVELPGEPILNGNTMGGASLLASNASKADTGTA